MRTRIFLLAAFAAALLCGRQRPVHIFMAGDSTMADKPLTKTVTDSLTGETCEEPFPEKGWGQLLPEFFNSKVAIVNYAQNGRSTRTFESEGWWQKIMDGVQPGDFVVIQFGHNDSSPAKADRYTSPADYRKNLERFAAQVQAKGATPILCTPVVRRRFDAGGRFEDSHGEYPGIVRWVAKEKKLLMVDMHAKSMELVSALGEECSKSLYLHLASGENRNFPGGNTDNTHFNARGAEAMAALFAESLRELKVKPLVKNLKK